jgi:hypothetical protein
MPYYRVSCQRARARLCHQGLPHHGFF